MDLRALTPLLAAPGPFATVYLATHRASEQAAAAFDVLWKDVHRELADAGADAATIDALDAARGSHTDGGTIALVAAGGRVLLRQALPAASDTTLVRVAPLPHLLPLLGWAQSRVPHVVALVDHSGGDVLAYSAELTAGNAPVDAGTVPAADGPAHKTGGGGYNEKRNQRTVENSWEETAHRVVAAVQAASAEVGAQVVLLGGDAREVGLLREALPHDLAPLVAVVKGGRAADGGAAHLADEILAALDARIAADTADVLDRFATYRGRASKDRARPIVTGQTADGADEHDPALQAADGVADVVAALRMGAVDTVLLAVGADEDRTVLTGPDPLQLAITGAELADLGVSAPVEALLVDALARAALAQDATLRLVPAGVPDAPADGVGALLRYSLPAA